MSYQAMEGRRWGIRYTLRDQAGNTKQKGEKNPVYLMISTTWHSGAGTRERKNESGQTHAMTRMSLEDIFLTERCQLQSFNCVIFFFLKHV